MSSRFRPKALGAMMLLSLGAAACGTPASESNGADDASNAPVETTATQTGETGADTADDSQGAEPVGDANTRLVGAFESLDGSVVNLAEFHSEDLVLWMWAPW